MSEIIDAARRFKSSLHRNEVVLLEQMADRYAQIVVQLQGEIDAIARTMAERRARGLPVTRGYLHRTQRYRLLQEQAYDELVRFEGYATDAIARHQALFARLGREYAQLALDLAEPGWGATFTRLSPEVIEVAAGFVADGSPLRTLLEDAWPHSVNRMSDALVTGVGLGYNPRRIARMMVEGLSSGLYRATVIARTETQRAQRVAVMDAWRATGVVVGYQRVSTHDKRVCPACLFAEGEFYRSDEDFAEHPQGRCVVVPVTRRSGRHTWQLGPEWFVAQRPQTQIAILGQGRYAAWRAGQFNLTDIPERVPNDTWGPSLRARTLQELIA